MPELPEVENIRRGLKSLIGQKISQVFRSEKKLRLDSTLNLQSLVGLKLKNISRKARYLILDFERQKSLLIHLGMSGRITINLQFQGLKHDHLAIRFFHPKILESPDQYLIFNDPRRFGLVDLIETTGLKTHSMLSKLGVEPLSDQFDSNYLSEKLRIKKLNIKTTLMDNQIVVGIGNIYVNEALFAAKISPLRPSFLLTKNEIQKLVLEIKKILNKAIKLGGSSISDYVNATGNLGNFQKTFKVYGRENEKCLICKALLRRIAQSGRSSFYCPDCQK